MRLASSLWALGGDSARHHSAERGAGVFSLALNAGTAGTSLYVQSLWREGRRKGILTSLLGPELSDS